MNSSIINKKKAKKNLLENLNNIDISKLNNSEINFFKNKKILIIGISGLIGLNLLFLLKKIEKFSFSNIYIDGIFNTSLFSFIKNYFKGTNKINFYKINLTKKKINSKKKYDLIFHCATYAQPNKFLKYKDSTYKLNSSVLMDLKNNLNKNSKFIYISSTEIYSGNSRICSEEDVGSTSTNHPRSVYIDSKKFGESYIINSFKNYLIFRACLIYGAGSRLDDERVLNQVIIRSLKNKKIDIFGGLKQLRSNLYVSDAVVIILKAVTKFNDQVFNLSNNKFSTLHSIFKLISQISKKKLVYHKEKLKGSPGIIKISNKKILSFLKYKISIKLREGLLRTRDWYKNLIILNN